MFNENSGYTPTPLILYPEISDYGPNVLNEKNTHFVGGIRFDQFYSFAAESLIGLPLKIELKLLNGRETSGGFWVYELGSKQNWNISDYNFDEHSQIFTMIEPGTPSNLRMGFMPEGSFTIEVIYHEGGGAMIQSRVIHVETVEN